MNVMLSVWKRMVNYLFKKRKNRQLSERLFKKPGSYNVFRSDWKGFFRIVISVSFGFGRFLSDLDGFFRTWISDSTFGFSSEWIGYFFRFGYIKSIKTGPHVKAREHSILS